MDRFECWFCQKEDTDCFTMEWDAYVHESCVYREAELLNPEALCILEEWGEDERLQDLRSRYPQEEYFLS